MNVHEMRTAASGCDLEQLTELRAEELERDTPRQSVLDYIAKRIKREQSKLIRPQVIGSIECAECGLDVVVKKNKNGTPYYFCQVCGCEHRVKWQESIPKFLAKLKKPEQEKQHEIEAKPKIEKSTGGGSSGSGGGIPIGCF